VSIEADEPTGTAANGGLAKGGLATIPAEDVSIAASGTLSESYVQGGALNTPEALASQLTEPHQAPATAPQLPRNIAVIGGGPAGLFAAEALAQAGHAVTVYERMPNVGRKFLMAGRGGLNLTHSEPLDTFVTRYGAANVALTAALAALPPADLVTWCEYLGEPTFVGTSGRVFPKSFKASPLLRAWLRRLVELGVTFKTRHDWLGWADDRALRFATPTGDISVTPEATVFALGGASWPRLGADGSWQAVLGAHDIDMAPLTPSNCGVQIEWSSIFANRFAGHPLKSLALTCGDARVRGEALVTATGLEGGAVYALGPSVREELAKTGTARLFVDFRPDLNLAALAGKLAGGRQGRSTATMLAKARLSPAAIGLMRETTGGPLPHNATELATLAKRVPIIVTALSGMERAISSAGGVRFSALDACLMLKAKPGHFVAGEMLDWDAPTGGYLLQASFASGMAAARGAIAWLSLAERSD
jgi:uncharacterized flavoprotein (TIGR03862 family)